MRNQVLTRSERRQMKRAKEKHVKSLMKGGYNKFRDVTNDPHTQDVIARTGIKPDQVFMNNMFVVQVYKHDNEWGADRVMIRWSDARPDHDWSLFQKIKNDIFGPERVALEVYPAESNRQDVANVYWLWVLPQGFDCPIEVKKGARC